MSANLLLILVGLTLGAALKKTGRLPADAAKSFNAFVIWVSLPAVVLVQLPKLLDTIELRWSILVPVSMAWILFGLALGVFITLGKKLGWSREIIGALVLTAGLGNTSFVGFPMLEAMLGKQAIPVALICDQAGTFLVLSIAGLVFASLYAPNARVITARYIAHRVFTFPPFAMLIVAGLMYALRITLPDNAQNVCERLAATLVPLAMIAVGYQLKFALAPLRQRWLPLALGLSFKLVLIPLFFYVLYCEIFGVRDFASQVTVLESAMAPMITAGVIAEEFGFDADTANLMISVGIPISLATVLFWNAILF